MNALALTETPGPLRTLAHLADHGLFIIVVLAVAFAATKIMRFGVTVTISLLARRSRKGAKNFWLVRMPRAMSETDDIADLRRDQRVRAASLMLSRVASISIWMLSLIAILAGLDVDIVWAVSSAGFLGAAAAIGGQHSVHDYLNGLHILLEDRFGEGDVIEVTNAAGLVRTGTVERLGTFSTRLKGENTTWHLSNRTLAEVSNLSQRANPIEFGIALDNHVAATQVEAAMVESLHTTMADSNSSVVVDGVELVESTPTGQHHYRVVARTTAALDTGQHQALETDLMNRLGTIDFGREPGSR